MKITFCGAAREITGSAHLLTLDDGYKILLDCGLYQGNDDLGGDFNRHWEFEPKDIDCLILSHAHIDHTGRVPQLVKDGFNGEILCTHATRSLCSIMLSDSAYIQEKDAAYQSKKTGQDIKPLYKNHDVRKALSQFVGLSYERWYRVAKNVRVFFRDAGHILGSASITLEIKEGDKTTMFGFTGDIGRPMRPILRDPKPMPEVDYLICESTYGHKDHTSAPAEIDELLHVITTTCIDNGGKLLIPAFSVGRTQEILYMLDQLVTYHQMPKIQVYVDSPLATNATEIFGMHPECFDDELNDYLEEDPNPWGFKSLRYIRDVNESKALNRSDEPCIIIASSGMADAGRIRHHIYNHISKPNTGLLIVGYCSPNTTGGRLRDGAKKIKIFGDTIPVNATVYVMDSFSAHADRYEMLAFIRNQFKSLKGLFLVHGNYKKQLQFKEFLSGFGFDQVTIPDWKDQHILD